MKRRLLSLALFSIIVITISIFVPAIFYNQVNAAQNSAGSSSDTEYVYSQGGYVTLNLPPSALYNKTNLRLGFMDVAANSTKGAEDLLDIRVWVPEVSRYAAVALLDTNPVAIASLAKLYAGTPSVIPILVNSNDLQISKQADYTVVNLTRPINVQWGDPNPQFIKNLNFTIPAMTIYFTTTGAVYDKQVMNTAYPSGWNTTTTVWNAQGWASVSIPSWIGIPIPTAAIMQPVLNLVAIPPPAKDIVDTAQASGSFNILLKALDAANLTSTLKGPGPFTVFAPTDAAFNALPPGVLDYLLTNKTALTQVLLYHVAQGKLLASDIIAAKSVTTLQGGSLPVTVSGDVVKVGPATVINADILCSNGVIHVIDKVLIPPGIMNIVQTAQYYGFSTLVTALQAANLTTTLSGSGPFTVFAPTDAAFAALPTGTLNALLANTTALTNVLLYHVVSGNITPSQLASQSSLTTLQGKPITISSTSTGIKVNNANVVGSVVCSNGIIYIIDNVLIPS